MRKMMATNELKQFRRKNNFLQHAQNVVKKKVTGQAQNQDQGSIVSQDGTIDVDIYDGVAHVSLSYSLVNTGSNNVSERYIFPASFVDDIELESLDVHVDGVLVESRRYEGNGTNAEIRDQFATKRDAQAALTEALGRIPVGRVQGRGTPAWPGLILTRLVPGS